MAHKFEKVIFGSPENLDLLGMRKMEILATSLKAGQAELSLIELRLAGDTSKTQVSAAIDAKNQAKKYMDIFDKEALLDQEKLQKQIDELLRKSAGHKKIKDEIDFVILQNYVPLFTKKNVLFDIAKLDVNAARVAVFLPYLQHQINLNAGDMAKLDLQIAKHHLGSEFEILQQKKTDLETLQKVWASIFETYEKTDKELEFLQENVAGLAPGWAKEAAVN